MFAHVGAGAERLTLSMSSTDSPWLSTLTYSAEEGREVRTMCCDNGLKCLTLPTKHGFPSEHCVLEPGSLGISVQVRGRIRLGNCGCMTG